MSGTGASQAGSGFHPYQPPHQRQHRPPRGRGNAWRGGRQSFQRQQQHPTDNRGYYKPSFVENPWAHLERRQAEAQSSSTPIVVAADVPSAVVEKEKNSEEIDLDDL